MLAIADVFCRLLLQFLLKDHLLILLDPTWIYLVQIWIALVPKGTSSVFKSMEKRNWNRSKRNWEIPISDQNRSAIIHLHLIYFHHLILHILKSKTKLHNQHIIFYWLLKNNANFFHIKLMIFTGIKYFFA